MSDHPSTGDQPIAHRTRARSGQTQSAADTGGTAPPPAPQPVQQLQLAAPTTPVSPTLSQASHASSHHSHASSHHSHHSGHHHSPQQLAPLAADTLASGPPSLLFPPLSVVYYRPAPATVLAAPVSVYTAGQRDFFASHEAHERSLSHSRHSLDAYPSHHCPYSSRPISTLRTTAPRCRRRQSAIRQELETARNERAALEATLREREDLLRERERLYERDARQRDESAKQLLKAREEEFRRHLRETEQAAEAREAQLRREGVELLERERAGRQTQAAVPEPSHRPNPERERAASATCHQPRPRSCHPSPASCLPLIQPLWTYASARQPISHATSATPSAMH